MKKRYKINPNTEESLNVHYSKINPCKERMNAWMFPYLDQYVPNEGNVLDVGGGYGKTLSILHEKNYKLDLTCFDYSTVAAEGGKATYLYIEFVCERIETWATEKKFDLIICSQTLEHVDEPQIVIDKMLSLLSEDGVLFITVPYPNSGLDMGVKLHHWTFYESDFPGAKCIRNGSHLMVVYKD